MEKKIEATIRVRMSKHDAHYAGDLVDGAKILNLFGDVATELLIKLDGDEGLFKAYESVEFMAQVVAGDYIEARGKIIEIGNTSRTMMLEAWKVISPDKQQGRTAAKVLDPPVLVCRANGVCVTPKSKQRFKHGK